jgi:radical SAM protein with 4Fe4S-binding SPASM domain
LDCEIPDKKKLFSQRFGKMIRNNRIPINGSINLTARCNFNCIHCYIPGIKRKNTRPNHELDTDFYFKLIDNITEAGCLNLLITGGEPFLRKDFNEIYVYAKEKGLIITIFTNGSLVNKNHIDIFRKYPPSLVEISVYGSSPETYEKITGVQDSFRLVMDGIERLHNNGIRIALKTVLMDINRHELDSIKDIATKLAVNFRFDLNIIPRLDSDVSPLGRRLNPEDAVEIEFKDPEKAEFFLSYFETHEKLYPNDQLFTCGAGRYGFHVSEEGLLKPCMMVQSPYWDLTKCEFKNSWNECIDTINNIKIDSKNPCRNCELKNLCGYCPPLFGLEKGEKNSCSEYMCLLCNLRYQKILSLS